MLPSNGILDIITIIYYFPALLVAIYAGLKHGFQRSAGWFNLNLLALFRLVGSILGLVGIYQPSTGVIAASLVFSSMGTASLVGTLLGLIGRANQSLGDRAFAPRTTRFIQLATIAAIVLAIIGGNEAYKSDPSTRAQGHTLSKAAIILIVVIYAIAAGICFHTFAMRSFVPACERRLLNVCLFSLPFILVRLVFAVCAVFDYTNSAFSTLSTSNTAIVLRAIMGLLMEFIVVALFLWAGCTVNRTAAREAERAQNHHANGIYQGRDGLVRHSVIATHNKAGEV